MEITAKNVKSVFSKARKKLEEQNIDYKKLITEILTPYGKVKIEWVGEYEVRIGTKEATDWLNNNLKSN